jgi:hypothetical protein
LLLPVLFLVVSVWPVILPRRALGLSSSLPSSLRGATLRYVTKCDK